MDKELPPPWRIAAHEQGMTLRWLAKKTGKSPATVYAYSCGVRVPPPEWLAEVWQLIDGRGKAA